MIANSTAVILCGGLSTRMKMPKYKLFLERIILHLKDFENIALSVRDENQISEYNFQLLPDLVRDCGPLGGIFTALKMSKTKYIFVTPCDAPNITREFIAELYKNLTDDDICLLPVFNGSVQPLIGIYKTCCADEIERALNEKIYSVKKFLSRLKVHYVNFGEEWQDVFRNINTQKEYKEWLNLSS